MPYKIKKKRKLKTQAHPIINDNSIKKNSIKKNKPKKYYSKAVKTIETQESINVAQNKELQHIKEEYEAEIGQVTIIKDITNSPTFRKYTRMLSVNQRKYLNAL